MTVRELIEELQKSNPEDLPVVAIDRLGYDDTFRYEGNVLYVDRTKHNETKIEAYSR